MRTTRNAIIRSTSLGYEDHGIFTFFLHLDYGGSGQGAGGYALSHMTRGNEKVIASKRIGQLLVEILRVVGVDRWESLPGKSILADMDNGKVYRIGHYLQDKWLDFEQFLNDDISAR